MSRWTPPPPRRPLAAAFPAAVALLLAALPAASGCSKSAPAAPPERAARTDGFKPEAKSLEFIKVETVTESDATTAITLTGRVAFDEDHTQRVASPIDGRATALLVRPGDHVKAGQAILELSSPHVGQLQADAQKADQDLAIANKALDRARRLRGDGAISDREVAQAEADFKKARSDVARANAGLKALGLSAVDPAVNIALRAQVSGTVVERNVLVGQEVRADAAAPLLTISSLDSVWVLADVYEQDLGLVENGAEVAVHVPAYPGESFPGRVGHIGEVVDASTRTVKIRCVVPNPKGRLKPEMFARIELKNVGDHKVLMVPTRAVINDGDRSKVILAGEGGVFRERQVDVGPAMEDKVRVLGGLKPGERIVTDGAIFLLREIATR